MKILLVCAGGMSTSILLQKMERYWKEQGLALDVKDVGLAEYEDVYQEYEIVLVGPQVAYRLKEIVENTQLPCATIEAFDYAMGDCDKILNLAKELYTLKKITDEMIRRKSAWINYLKVSL